MTDFEDKHPRRPNGQFDAKHTQAQKTGIHLEPGDPEHIGFDEPVDLDNPKHAQWLWERFLPSQSAAIRPGGIFGDEWEDVRNHYKVIAMQTIKDGIANGVVDRKTGEKRPFTFAEVTSRLTLKGSRGKLGDVVYQWKLSPGGYFAKESFTQLSAGDRKHYNALRRALRKQGIEWADLEPGERIAWGEKYLAAHPDARISRSFVSSQETAIRVSDTVSFDGDEVSRSDLEEGLAWAVKDRSRQAREASAIADMYDRERSDGEEWVPKRTSGQTVQSAAWDAWAAASIVPMAHGSGASVRRRTDLMYSAKDAIAAARAGGSTRSVPDILGAWGAGYDASLSEAEAKVAETFVDVVADRETSLRWRREIALRWHEELAVVEESTRRGGKAERMTDEHAYEAVKAVGRVLNRAERESRRS